MHVDIVIPYSTDGNIGRAYNRTMSCIPHDGWVAFQDYDVIQCNPHWHSIIVHAIQTYRHAAGMISCFTNRIGCKLQIAAGVDIENHDQRYHQEIASNLWKNNGHKCVDCTDRGGRFSGMFFVTSRNAWESVGGFREDGLYHVDVDYYDKVKRAGYRTYIMAGMYCYHRYMRETAPNGKPLFEMKA